MCDWLGLHHSSCLELIAVLCGIASIGLGVFQLVSTWPVGIVNIVLSAVVFARTGLYSDVGLQAVYLALAMYGWREWIRLGPAMEQLRVSRTSAKAWVTLVSLGFAIWLSLGAITSHLPGAAIPYADAAAVSVSIIAQWMTTKKLLENWLLWIVVNASYVALLLYKGLFLFAANFLVYLALAVAGFVAWRRTMPSAVRA
jgi:nicotinamide mononucleotide transporter